MANQLSGLMFGRIDGQGYDLCYERLDRGRFSNLPTVTFHMVDSDMFVEAENVFYLGTTATGGQYFCLAMMSIGRDITVIGVKQQTDKRLIFDTIQRKSYFGPEDCSRGGRKSITPTPSFLLL